MTETPVERFSSYLRRTVSGCIEWTGGKTRDGYGKFKVAGRSVRAHRYAYESAVGPIPVGSVLDHLCRNRACVNPQHLEPVTPQQNARRGETGINERSKTRCPQGHLYSGENLYTARGKRGCRTCRRRAVRRYEERKRASQP